MFHARMPSQVSSVGGWANVHGQGMLQLQVSNQSPVTCQRGTSGITPPFVPNHVETFAIIVPLNEQGRDALKGLRYRNPRRDFGWDAGRINAAGARAVPASHPTNGVP